MEKGTLNESDKGQMLDGSTTHNALGLPEAIRHDGWGSLNSLQWPLCLFSSYLLPRSPTFLPRSPTFLPRSPTFLPRSPTFLPRSPTFLPRSPTFLPRGTGTSV
uniref:Uncharacterized protein n=1 Tax=Salmo trutta TaxID=8032 RepID=A0A674E7E3_SALTR